MKTIIVIFLSCVLGLDAVAGNNNAFPFASTPPPSSFSNEPAISRISGFNATIRNNRVLLNWNVESNQETNQLEVERSNDGKNFIMAALVFGTDKADTDSYQFFEKTKAKKLYYRIKIQQKDQRTSYSDVIVAVAEK